MARTPRLDNNAAELALQRFVESLSSTHLRLGLSNYAAELALSSRDAFRLDNHAVELALPLLDYATAAEFLRLSRQLRRRAGFATQLAKNL